MECAKLLNRVAFLVKQAEVLVEEVDEAVGMLQHSAAS